jgi:uncharacterized Zn ribbon protein
MPSEDSQVKNAQVRSEDHNVVINISNNSSEEKKYFCSHCNSRLTPFTQQDKIGGYLCVKCQIEYWPNQQPVKKADKFDLPGPATDEHGNVLGDIDIPIVMMDSPIEPSSTAFKQKKLTAAFEALSRHGFKFTTYEER